MIITLPWPDSKLSPNGRAHRKRVASVKAKARKDAAYLTFDAMQKHLATKSHFQGEARLPFRVTFYPPDKRHRDDDNMIGSFKAYRDGIADALGVNDRQFRPEYVFADPVKPGRVEVEIIPAIHGDKSLPDSAFVLEQSGPSGATNTDPALTKTVYRGDD